MTAFYLAGALFLLANVVVALARVLRGPTAADRMLSGALMGTTAVAVLLLLYGATGIEALIDVALIFAILAAMAVVTFVRRTWPEDADEDRPREEP
ncbi:MAG: hypothetical protein JJT88_16225 [Gammaproteobacteria bacterium]|nr:hypothetical protein [Gammaproteobacteria bacterium]